MGAAFSAQNAHVDRPQREAESGLVDSALTRIEIEAARILACDIEKLALVAPRFEADQEDIDSDEAFGNAIEARKGEYRRVFDALRELQAATTSLRGRALKYDTCLTVAATCCGRNSSKISAIAGEPSCLENRRRGGQGTLFGSYTLLGSIRTCRRSQTEQDEASNLPIAKLGPSALKSMSISSRSTEWGKVCSKEFQLPPKTAANLCD